MRFFEAPDSIAEAEFICGEISSLVRNNSDARIAVLYRTGAQSRSFEEVLRRLGIRYRVVGGFSFYERAEVRNALAYVRLLFHPEDDVALLRVLNVPPRGIGATTVASLEARARETGQSLWDVIRAGEFSTGKKIAGALNSFREMIEGLQEECRELSPAQLIERVLDRTGYLDWVEQQDNLEHTSRADNLRELSNAMAEATEQGQTLEDLLDHAALASDSDAVSTKTIPVSLMTLHSAKGLEFDAVFLAGLEEGVLPHSRSIDTPGGSRRGAAAFLRGHDAREKVPGAFARDLSPQLRRGSAARFPAVAIPRGNSARFDRSRRGIAIRAGRNASLRTRSGILARDHSYRRASRTPYRPSALQARLAAISAASKNPLIGTRVRHSKYGIGTIIEVEGDGEDRSLTVSFQDYGPKKLLERYANLQLA